MTIYLRDKSPKKGMLQAAKEQGFEEAMQQVEMLQQTIEDLQNYGKKRETELIEKCALAVAADLSIPLKYRWKATAAIRVLKDKP